MGELGLLDTNPILRHILDDHPGHSPRVHSFFERLASGEESVQTTDTIIFEAAFTLERFYKVPRSEIGSTLLDLLQIPGLVLPSKSLYPEVFGLWIKHGGLSFADCYHAVLVRRLGLASIVSFDRGFDRIPGIQRREP
jgi:predicted nucleic acid-binding protein